MKSLSLLFIAFLFLKINSFAQLEPSNNNPQQKIFSEQSADAFNINLVTAPNGIYIEVFGQGIFPTVNYERMLITTTPHNIALRVGAGIWVWWGGSGFVFPLTASYLFGSNHKLEVGAGFVIATTDSKDELATGGVTAVIGYRYQPIDGGFIFRLGFTPIIVDDGIFPWGGLSIGYAF